MNQELIKNKSEVVIKINILYSFLKRTVDIIIGVIGTILLIPTSIILKIAFIVTKDKGPLFFVQKRVGKNGKTIYIYKYRSMIVGAENKLKKMMKKDKNIREEYQKNKKLKNDPRITKVGKFIRRTCIDEMPQFINLLKGNMTLIGPRPYLFSEIKDIGDAYFDIISVKPGITGLWQVSDKEDMSFQRRCIIEKYYANNYGLMLDLKIFIKTFGTILGNHGTK